MAGIKEARLDILSQSELEQLAQKTQQEAVFRGIGLNELWELRRDGQDSFTFHKGTYWHNRLSEEPIFRSQFKNTGILVMHEITSDDVKYGRFQHPYKMLLKESDNYMVRVVLDNVFYQCQKTFTGKVYVCEINEYK